MKTNQKISCAITAALSASAGAAFAAADVGAAGGVEEVVVTAQRRAESIQDVPITIQAITGDQLAQLNVTTFDDVLRYLPNVTFSPNGPGQGNIYMRGLSAGFAGNQSSASIAPFPNVATYLDEQSMTFPSRNVDVYMVDMQRVEVLEGPQGTLFGGGAEAGAIRYITNKPKLSATEGTAEFSYGTTAHGDPNTAVNGTLNLPLIPDKLAVRGVFYNDKRGGYIDNVPSTFTRKASDPGPGGYSSAYPASVLGVASANNFNLAKRAQNPLTYNGFRVSALYQFSEDWNALIQQSYQNMEADGMSAQFPISSEGVALGPWEETSFSPSYDKDRYSATAWTVNGKFADLRAIYTGSYLTRHINNTMDYTNYARSQGGFYYTCVGGPAAGTNFGAPGPGVCYSPVSSWEDTVESTHQSHEIRLSTPDEWRLRGLVGAYWEKLEIKDDMNFLYKSIPGCTPHNLAIALAGGPLCLAAVQPINAAIDPSIRNDNVAFGEDLRRGYKQTAFFASVDFDLLPKVLTLTAGTRHFKYDESEFGSQYKTNSTCINKPEGQCHVDAINRSGNDSGYRSRAGLSWHVVPDTMLYYTFSQGFRPGAFNRVASGVTKICVDPATGQAVPNGTLLCPKASRANQFFKPVGYPSDTLINNEIGIKSEFFNHRLLFDAAAYKMKWKDVQTQIYNPPVYGNTTFGIQGPDYEIKGFEVQFIGKITDGLTLQGSLSYNHSEQINSPCIISPGVVPGVTDGNPTPAGQCITQVRAGGTNVPVINPLGGVGDTPAFSPKLEYNLRVRYDWTVNDMKAFATLGGNYVGEMANEPSGFTSGDTEPVPKTTWLRYTQPSYHTFDAALGLAKGNWTCEAFGSNLGNSSASLFTSSSQFVKAEIPLRPRVLGVKLGLKF